MGRGRGALPTDLLFEALGSGGSAGGCRRWTNGSAWCGLPLAISSPEDPSRVLLPRGRGGLFWRFRPLFFCSHIFNFFFPFDAGTKRELVGMALEKTTFAAAS